MEKRYCVICSKEISFEKLMKFPKQRCCSIVCKVKSRESKYRLGENGIKEKQCSKCKNFKELNRFFKNITQKNGLESSCKDCRNDYIRNKFRTDVNFKNKKKDDWNNFYKKNREKVKGYYLKSSFNISIDTYKDMLKKQNNVCAICNNSEIVKYKKGIRSLAVDHNHKTGKVRGLLCGRCNKGLGGFKDDIKLLKNALEYLTKYPEITSKEETAE